MNRLAHGSMLALALLDATLTAWWAVHRNPLAFVAAVALVYQIWVLRGFIRWHVERWVENVALEDVGR